VTETRHPTLIASPQVSFAELRKRLTESGWDLESSNTGPILAGEPELAVWVHRQDSTAIHYTFNPVVKLRVLQFRGVNADARCREVGHHIPIIAASELRELLESADVRKLLLALFAAEELSEISVLEQIEKLCAHTDGKIARTAVRVRDSLTTAAVNRVVQQLAEEQAQKPEISIWFSHLPQPELRKQVLRWLMRDWQRSNLSIDQVLRAALKDSDPEVRITAVLAAARLNARNLIPAIREADIPTSSRHGADERDRLFYERLRQTAVGYLSMGDPAHDVAKQQRLQFQRAVSGQLEVRDDPTLLLYSLTTPVELGDKPACLPAAVEERDDGYYLRRSGFALRWIAPISHWVGEDSARAPLPNPIRRVIPRSGFFIAETPIDFGLATWISEGKPSHFLARPAETEPFPLSYVEAARRCDRLGQLEGIPLKLPTADQWEMAARGPDGRRYPWGNSLTEAGPRQPSPWRVKNMVGKASEWTGDQTAQGSRIVCGGRKSLVCARREAVSGNDSEIRCAVRPVLDWAAK
jgi:hypothetical protein